MQEPRAVRVRSTDGVTVVAHDRGGDGQPVVFCHATGFHARCWDPVIARLQGPWRCVAIDLRGHGDAEIPEGLELGWQGMADDVLAVVDALDLGVVKAVGHSMGGCSIVMAELTRPGTVERAWMFEPILIPAEGGPFHAPEENPLAASARRRREVFDSRDAAFERYGSRPPFGRCDPEWLRAYVDHGFADQPDGTVILKCRGEIEASVFEASRTDAFERLGELATVVTVAGSGDGAGPALIAPIAAEAMPHGTFEPWPDLTHFGPFEDPARIAAAIDAALTP